MKEKKRENKKKESKKKIREKNLVNKIEHINIFTEP